jgi:mRNA interferase RelE/StbE
VSYSIRLAPAAERQLKKLQAQVRNAILPVIKSLANDPRPQGAKKLKGDDDIWRVRKGNYRILYQIQDDELIVLVVRIDDRKQVYKNM